MKYINIIKPPVSLRKGGFFVDFSADAGRKFFVV